MKKEKKDLIFECRKCGHNLYVNPERIKLLFTRDCPNCGEEAGELWILIGEGVFEKIGVNGE